MADGYTRHVHLRRPGGTPNAAAAQFNAPAGPPAPQNPFVDLAAYPILTEEVGYPPSPLAKSGSGTATGTCGGAPLGQIAMKAVADVLGWKIKNDDPKGFVGALTQAFTLTEVQGHVESKWMPRSYAVQSDLSGGITGAQASLYSRAQEALTQSVPLLNGLYPLNPQADQEYVTALREIVRSQFTELVNEFGYAGGPRVWRVNQYFTLLLGSAFVVPGGATPVLSTSNSDLILGTLGNLRDVYGIFTLGPLGASNQLVNTIDDEQDTTNFRIISDYLTSLALTWINNYAFFGASSATPFLGTQLILISRQLSVVSESVDDLRFALDSVFIGPSERQTLEIVFTGTAASQPMYLEDLLDWVKSVVSDEAPGVIQTGGKFGVFQIVQIVTQLYMLVNGAQTPINAAAIPAGYFTPRVQLALNTLADQLNDLITIANQVTITSLPVNPS